MIRRTFQTACRTQGDEPTGDVAIILLGDAFYENLPAVFKYNLLSENILDTIGKVENYNFDVDINHSCVGHFKNRIFITGDWRSPDEKLIGDSVTRILS